LRFTHGCGYAHATASLRYLTTRFWLLLPLHTCTGCYCWFSYLTLLVIYKTRSGFHFRFFRFRTCLRSHFYTRFAAFTFRSCHCYGRHVTHTVVHSVNLVYITPPFVRIFFAHAFRLSVPLFVHRVCGCRFASSVVPPFSRLPRSSLPHFGLHLFHLFLHISHRFLGSFSAGLVGSHSHCILRYIGHRAFSARFAPLRLHATHAWMVCCDLTPLVGLPRRSLTPLRLHLRALHTRLVGLYILHVLRFYAHAFTAHLAPHAVHTRHTLFHARVASRGFVSVAFTHSARATYAHLRFSTFPGSGRLHTHIRSYTTVCCLLPASHWLLVRVALVLSLHTPRGSLTLFHAIRFACLLVSFSRGCAFAQFSCGFSFLRTLCLPGCLVYLCRLPFTHALVFSCILHTRIQHTPDTAFTPVYTRCLYSSLVWFRYGQLCGSPHLAVYGSPHHAVYLIPWFILVTLRFTFAVPLLLWFTPLRHCTTGSDFCARALRTSHTALSGLFSPHHTSHRFSVTLHTTLLVHNFHAYASLHTGSGSFGFTFSRVAFV